MGLLDVGKDEANEIISYVLKDEQISYHLIHTGFNLLRRMTSWEFAHYLKATLWVKKNKLSQGQSATASMPTFCGKEPFPAFS